MVYLGPVGSWKTNPFMPPKQEHYTGPPLAVRTCVYCGKPVPITRTTCKNCGAPSSTGAPQAAQAAQDTDALFRSIDVAELVQHPATITVCRQRWMSLSEWDLIMMLEYLGSTDSGAWIMSRTVMGKLARVTSATGEYLISPVTSAPVQLFGFPLHWSAQSPHLGEIGDVALVDWRVYHRLNGGWPDSPVADTTRPHLPPVSPFVVLGEGERDE